MDAVERSDCTHEVGSVSGLSPDQVRSTWTRC